MAAGEFILRPVTQVATADLSAIVCGSESLEEFLNEQALEYHQSGLTFTSLMYLEGGEQIPVA